MYGQPVNSMTEREINMERAVLLEKLNKQEATPDEARRYLKLGEGLNVISAAVNELFKPERMRDAK